MGHEPSQNVKRKNAFFLFSCRELEKLSGHRPAVVRCHYSTVTYSAGSKRGFDQLHRRDWSCVQMLVELMCDLLTCRSWLCKLRLRICKVSPVSLLTRICCTYIQTGLIRQDRHCSFPLLKEVSKVILDKPSLSYEITAVRKLFRSRI